MGTAPEDLRGGLAAAPLLIPPTPPGDAGLLLAGFTEVFLKRKLLSGVSMEILRNFSSLLATIFLFLFKVRRDSNRGM